MRSHPYSRWRLALAGAAGLMLTLTMNAGATGAAAAVPPPAATGAVPSVEVYELTLVTGDQVEVARSADDREAVTIDPADRTVEASFETVTLEGETYVIPSDAAPLIPEVLDRELFNVTKLVESGYHDGVPVIIDYESSAPRPLATPQGVTGVAELSSIDAVAATIAPDGRWWSSAHAAAGVTGAGPLASGVKVWLDELAQVTLDESVPLIGAPDAWAAGYDGTGVTVAVLDTGIDVNHPDLAGKVIAEENFTADPDTSDEHGHGTHVAGTVAGSGAASGGTYTGVAHGAQLMNGKVCNSFGSCPTSSIISGMEWAATQGADIANLSIGGSPTDGSDPLSVAVNQLTDEHDILFVIAAGNSGALGDQTVAAPGAADAALTVGAVDKSEQLATFSGRGPRVGDFAIKPDITAPGVDIASARAEGTALGPIVDEHYTRISGTSMATPHVAGAAAIALQQDPALGATDLKATLAATAVPHPDLDVYQQGGGRVEVPAALDAPVRAAPSPLDLGYFQYPHDDAQPVSADVTYTNRTDEPVTLDLALDVTSREGEVPDEAMLSFSPGTVTVDPGGTAQVTVTLDAGTGAFGLYGGYLVASQDGEVATRTPVGFYKESERYELTVEGIARDGRPATGISSFDVADVDDITAFLETSNRFSDGTGTLRVPPGTYSVLGVIYSYDEPQIFVHERVMAGDPEVEVTGDTTVVLDAREANPISFETPQDVEALSGVSMGWWRQAEQVGSHSHTHTGLRVPQFAVETEPVTLGDFEFFSRHRLVAPQLQVEVVEPVRQDLSPAFMTGSPPVDSDDRLPLVYAGLGYPEDYENIDAEGSFVLVRRGEFSFAEKEANAAAAGAAAIAVANDVGGQFAGSVGDNATIPTMSLSMEEGDQLLDLLDGGDVTVRLSGQSVSPFMYDLVLPHPGHVPDDLTFVAEPEQLVSLDNRFHSDLAGHEMNEVRHFWRPWQFVSFGFTTPLSVPQQRDEYLVAGDTRYRQNLWAERPFTGQLLEPITFYDDGEQREQNWFRQVTRPGILDGGQFQASQPVVRDADDLDVRVQEWVDSDSHYGARHTLVDTSAFRLYEDGDLIAESARARGSFPVSPGPAEHRLELDVTRDAEWWTTSTQTRTAWTLQSQPPAGEPVVVPLLEVDYGVDLDLLNTAAHPRDRRGPPTVELTVRHQPGADGPGIDGARLWTSYDDGVTWHERPGADLGGGRFEFILDARDPDDTTGFVSLRVDAWDADGNRIEQEITRAWRLAPR